MLNKNVMIVFMVVKYFRRHSKMKAQYVVILMELNSYCFFRIRVFTCTEAGCTASAYNEQSYSTDRKGNYDIKT